MADPAPDKESLSRLRRLMWEQDDLVRTGEDEFAEEIVVHWPSGLVTRRDFEMAKPGFPVLAERCLPQQGKVGKIPR